MCETVLTEITAQADYEAYVRDMAESYPFGEPTMPEPTACPDPNDPTWTDTVFRRDGTLYAPSFFDDNGQRLPAEIAAKLTQIASPSAVRAGDRFYSGHGYWGTVIATATGYRVTVRDDADGSTGTYAASNLMRDGGKFYRVAD